MNKKFTKEDIIKKHQTNVKSAQGVFALAGMLGIIYIVRYFITGNFDFYFSLSFTQVWLTKIAEGTASADLGYSLSAIFIVAYFALCAVSAKKAKYLSNALSLYILDFAALIYSLITTPSFSADSLIDVILHVFVTVFLIAGIKSEKALREN
ncbi:MAG: hypothetical protein IJW86_01250 [Clostridia bacterium]|nr:hypothetical protein [Clostridia bacterium]